MEHAIVEDLDGDLLFWKFTCRIAENYDRDRIVSEARRGCRLWIPTLNPITLGFTPA